MNPTPFHPSAMPVASARATGTTGAKTLSIAVMIALATHAGTPAAWAQDTRECAENKGEGCGEQRDKGKGISGWTIGGIAALVGIGAAAGGGGGGGDSGSSNNNNGGNNGGTPTGSEGGSFGAGSSLTGTNQNTQWQQNLVTRVTGSNVRNAGRLDVLAGGLAIEGQGELDNRGEINIGPGATLSLRGDGELDNRSTMLVQGAVTLTQEASLENYGTLNVQQALITLSGDSDWDNESNASLTLDGSRMQLSEMAEFENHGRVLAKNPQSGSIVLDISTQRLPGEDDRQIVPFDNRGSMEVQGDASLLRLQATSYASVGYNRAGGTLSSTAAGLPMIVADGAQARFVNQGTITVNGDGAVAMSGRNNAVLVNEGTINLGVPGSTGRGMIAMQSDGSAQLHNSGTINIHARDSYAFGVAGGINVGVTNTGRINLYGEGSGHYAPATAIQRYTAASLADGSIGQLDAGLLGATLENAAVDTGFTAGTAATRVLLQDAFVGQVAGLDSLHSTSAVWQARALNDAQGNTDIEMVKRDYVGLVGAELAPMAAALDAGYTNSALFRSLELDSAQAVDKAIGQLSGAGLASGSARAVGAGQGFWSAMQARLPATGLYAAGFGNGLSNGWGPQGNGSAVGWVAPGRAGRLDLQAGLLSNRYGGSGHNSQDQLDSRYFGMGWSNQWHGIDIRHALNSESHRLDSTRTLRYGKISQQARSERDIQRHALSSFASRTFNAGATYLQPRLGATAYRQREAGFQEQAAEFGLNVGAGSASGLDLEAGLGLSRMLGAQWRLSGDAALIRPLSYSASQRQASFRAAPQVTFSLPQAERSGLDYRLSLGADHWRGNNRLHIGANVQRAFGERDHGVSGSWSHLF